MKYRLFVAVYPPAEAVAHLTGFLAGLHLGRAAAAAVNARLAPPERWHLTAAFLGDVDEARVSDVDTALAKAVAGWDAPAPRVRLAGGGRFGRGRFSIVWTGVDGEVAALRALAQGVRRQLKRARLPLDRKPFRPHLTLARPGDRLSAAELAEDLAGLAAYQGPSWTIEELRLIRSHLGPNPVHENLASFALPRSPVAEG